MRQCKFQENNKSFRFPINHYLIKTFSQLNKDFDFPTFSFMDFSVFFVPFSYLLNCMSKLGLMDMLSVTMQYNKRMRYHWSYESSWIHTLSNTNNNNNIYTLCVKVTSKM